MVRPPLSRPAGTKAALWRNLDLAFVKLVRSPTGDPFAEDLNIESLFNDDLAIVVGMGSRWARRRKINLSDLLNESWILTAPGTWTYSTVAEAFQARGHEMPELYLANILSPPARQSACRRYLRYSISEVFFEIQRKPVFTEGVTPQVANPSMAGNSHYFEKPNTQPSS